MRRARAQRKQRLQALASSALQDVMQVANRRLGGECTEPRWRTPLALLLERLPPAHRCKDVMPITMLPVLLKLCEASRVRLMPHVAEHVGQRQYGFKPPLQG